VGLYEFLRAQPRDVLIASLDEEVDFVPVFAGRSILVGFEYSIPYHLGYYRPFTERVTALMLAQYSPDLARLQEFLRAYRVTYVLLDPTELRRDTALKDAWLAQFETVTGVQSSMKSGAKPILDRLVRPCTVLQDGRLYLIDAACILNANPADAAKLPPFDKGDADKQ